MSQPFESFWKELTKDLKEKSLIRNWTKDKGYLTKGDFQTQINGNYIICETPETRTIPRVPKIDMEFMYYHWSDYLEGRISRKELTKGSRYTKYTISILQWYTDDGLG